MFFFVGLFQCTAAYAINFSLRTPCKKFYSDCIHFACVTADNKYMVATGNKYEHDMNDF
jgi:hypothetical protein